MNKKYLKTAFPDELTKVKLAHKTFHKHRDDHSSDWSDALVGGWGSGETEASFTSGAKRVALICFLIIAFFGLFLRIFHLQVIHGFENRDLADSNRIQIKIIHAPRGVIMDRNGKIMARNEPGFRLVERAGSSPKSQFLSRDEALKLEIGSDPVFQNLEIDSLRFYPLGEKASHVLGYVSEISAQELKDSRYKGYRPGDKIGRSGVEEVYEKFLRGIDGGEVIEVDSSGKRIRTLRQTPPVPGSNLVLSIDASLQEAAFNSVKKIVTEKVPGITVTNPCCGAVVAMDPGSGQVLSLVSYPSFDPQDLTPALTNGHSPMLNRAIAGVYPPGSTFKMISSFAGLSSGKIIPSTEFEDTGVLSLGPYKFANWYFGQYGKVEGLVNMKKAIQRSNDIYFYRLGQVVGEKALAQWAEKFGLGKTLGIDLPGEASGVVADNEWKLKNLKEQWYPGDTLHTSIGQGFTLTTPLQIAAMTSAIAMDGKQFLPHLGSKITTPQGATLKEFEFDPFVIKDLKKDDLAVIKSGMSLVPKQGGTAWPFFNFLVPTAGKTGTAEFGDPKGRTHAWYTSYAPEDNPRIVLTVLIEAGGEGSAVAGSVSKEIYKWYFGQDKSYPANLEAVPVATQSAKTMGE